MSDLRKSEETQHPDIRVNSQFLKMFCYFDGRKGAKRGVAEKP